MEWIAGARKTARTPAIEKTLREIQYKQYRTGRRRKQAQMSALAFRCWRNAADELFSRFGANTTGIRVNETLLETGLEQRTDSGKFL
jgi:hypothetical protein